MRDCGTFKERLGGLRRLPPVRRLGAILALLGTACEAERTELLVELIELAAPVGTDAGHSVVSKVRRRLAEGRQRVSQEALGALARFWTSVPEELKDAARSVGAGRWEGAAAGLAEDADPAVRRSLARLCADTGDAALAGSMVPLLGDLDPGIGADADRALQTLAQAAASGAAEPGARRNVEAAVARAVGTVSEHRRRGPFLAAMALLEPARLWRGDKEDGGPLIAWFKDPGPESLSALRAALRLSAHPLARRRALEWVGIPALSEACADRLSRGRTPEEHGVVLGGSHLLLNPRRGGAVRAIEVKAPRARVAGREVCAPDAAVLVSLETTARRGAPAFIACLKTTVETRRALLEPMLCDGDPMARLASLIRTTDAGTLDLCFDADPRVARSAMVLWSLAGERGPGGVFEGRLGLRDDAARRRALGCLGRSPHATVRVMAAQDRGSIDCLDPSLAASRACARWWARRDPAALEARLRVAMNDAEDGVRARAVRMVRALKWCGRFEPELLALVESSRGPAWQATATGVAALGELVTPSSIALVYSHLSHGDGRVRSNAVESLARQTGRTCDLGSEEPAAYGVLLELKDDRDHRVRANALRALLGRTLQELEVKPGAGAVRRYEPGAVGSLAEMLADERPAHRLSAAWLAGRVLPLTGRARLGRRFAELASRVGDMAVSDPDGDVRRRARQCVEMLRSELRTAWGGRARREQSEKGEKSAPAAAA